MGFLRTKSGELISLVDICRLYSVEHPGGGSATIAVRRADGVLVELARDYSIETLARVLDPVRAR